MDFSGTLLPDYSSNNKIFDPVTYHTPAFTRPAHHKHKLPAFNKTLIGKLQKRDVSRWTGFYYYDAFHHKTNKPVVRSRHFNKHRARAMNAMAQGISYHINMGSAWKTEIILR